jgi:protein-S-isoprenylcysteine O-methyltransferase Ste14
VAVSGATAGAAVLALAPPETALAGALASLALVGASKAAWDLRSAFAVLPAARGVVDHGAYRWLRHPMYAWQLVALLPGAVGNSWGWLWLVAAGLQVWRIREEEHVLGGLGDDWEAYTLRVRWRLVPGVW